MILLHELFNMSQDKHPAPSNFGKLCNHQIFPWPVGHDHSDLFVSWNAEPLIWLCSDKI